MHINAILSKLIFHEDAMKRFWQNNIFWLWHAITYLVFSKVVLRWLAQYFGGLSLDTEPDFGCGNIIDVCIHRNTNKLCTHHYLRQRHCAMDSFYLKTSFCWGDVCTAICIFFCNIFLKSLNTKNLVFSWTVWNFWDFKIIYFTVIFHV